MMRAPKPACAISPVATAAAALACCTSASISHSPSVHRIRASSALGAPAPFFVRPEAEAAAQANAQGGQQKQQAKPKKPASKSKAPRFPRVQHDDPLVSLDTGTLAI